MVRSRNGRAHGRDGTRERIKRDYGTRTVAGAGAGVAARVARVFLEVLRVLVGMLGTDCRSERFVGLTGSL